MAARQEAMEVSELKTVRQVVMKTNYKLDVVQRRMGDLQESMNRVEILLQRLANPQVRVVEPRNMQDWAQSRKLEMEVTRRIDDLRQINVRSTTEGNVNFPSTGLSVVVTGWGEDSLQSSSLASPTWNLNSSNGSEEDALSVMDKNADSNVVDEIQKDESALKGSDAKTKSNDPTEAPFQPVETKDKAEEKKGVNEFGDEAKINKGDAVKTIVHHNLYPPLINCLIKGDEAISAIVLDANKRLAETTKRIDIIFPPDGQGSVQLDKVAAQLYMGKRTDRWIRSTGLLWKPPPWPDFCAIICDGFAQHSGYEVLKNFHSVKPYNHSVSDYIDRFEELMVVYKNENPLQNPHFFVKCFTNGLRHDSKYYLKPLRPQTLGEAYWVSKDMEKRASAAAKKSIHNTVEGQNKNFSALARNKSVVGTAVQQKNTTLKPFIPGVCKCFGDKWFLGLKCRWYQQISSMVGEGEEVIPEKSEQEEGPIDAEEKPTLQSESGEQLMQISIQAVQGLMGISTYTLEVNIGGKTGMALVDSDSTNTFIDLTIATQTTCKIQLIPLQKVTVAGGGILWIGSYITAADYYVRGQKFSNSFKVLPLKGYDVVLGCDWLYQHSLVSLDLKTRRLTIMKNGITMVIFQDPRPSPVVKILSSKVGLKIDEPVIEANFNRQSSGANCKALIRCRVDEKGQWTVIRFVPIHNHHLAKPGERHMLRLAKSLAVGKSGVKDPAASVGPHQINGFSDMTEGGTAEPPGYTIRDCYNHVNMQGITMIEAGDCQSLVSYFKRKTNEEGMFDWDVQVDQESRMINFFFRDGKSRSDYDCFGDAVIFDTTYRTNKYSLICAPFVGVNHHWHNVVFGCAFLLDESTASYVWLFKSFLESMGGRSPKSIFTDQDEAIMRAIEQVFPNTQHCFSYWHILKNAQSHLGTVNTSQAFQNMFMKCMQGSDSEMELEESWAAMLHEYKLQDNNWLNDLYRFHHRWCSTFNKDTFDGGINSSQWGEVSNNILTGISDESTSLTRFALLLEKVVKALRRNESEEDFRCSQTAPVRAIKHSTVLKQAAESYTHRIYKLFEAEFLDGCGATSCHESSCGGNLLRFEITMQGRGSKVWAVLLDTSTMEISCGCGKFERMGLLCSHSLKAFSLQNVDTIPEKYILKRWTKDARRSMYKLSQEDSTQQECTEAELAYRNRTMQYAYNLITKSQELEESRKIFWDSLETGEKALEVFFEMRSLRTQAASKRDKKKKKSSKGPSFKKAKQAQPSSSAAPELLAQTNEHQFQSAQDAQGNATIGRPLYYQGFPTTAMQPNQIYMHPNLHMHPVCAPQDFSAYSAMRPNSNFGGAKNI